ncbi:hypothetical protein WDU94_011987 [Cyamophila willieti]
MSRFPVEKRLTGWRYVALISGLVGSIGLAMYPVIIKPMFDNTEYKEIQKIVRAGINQEEIQPGNMRVWSDPFKPLPPPK